MLQEPKTTVSVELDTNEYRTAQTEIWTPLSIQGLKYNFQGAGTVQLSGPPFISWGMNVLSMISYFFQCKNIQHCEFTIVKMWNLNDLLIVGLLQWRLLICWTQERRFRLWNPIILQLERSRLKFPGPRTVFRLTLTLVSIIRSLFIQEKLRVSDH